MIGPATLKRGARALVDTIASTVASFQIARAITRRSDNPLLVLDIDNTLADSWPTFAAEWPSERARLTAIEPLPHIKSQVHDPAAASGADVLFLSHRNPWHWGTTRRWLHRHGFAVAPRNLILVSQASEKVAHIRRLAESGPVDYWDDLSAGHETGTMTLYHDIISAVDEFDGVTYHGWSEIVGITGLGLDRTPGTAPRR